MRAGQPFEQAVRGASASLGGRPLRDDAELLLATVAAGRPLALTPCLSVLPPGVPLALGQASPSRLSTALNSLADLHAERARLELATAREVLAPVVLAATTSCLCLLVLMLVNGFLRMNSCFSLM